MLAQRGVADGQRPRHVGFGVGEPAAGVLDVGQVSPQGRHLVMVGAAGALHDGQGAAVALLQFGQGRFGQGQGVEEELPAFFLANEVEVSVIHVSEGTTPAWSAS